MRERAGEVYRITAGFTSPVCKTPLPFTRTQPPITQRDTLTPKPIYIYTNIPDRTPPNSHTILLFPFFLFLAFADLGERTGGGWVGCCKDSRRKPEVRPRPANSWWWVVERPGGAISGAQVEGSHSRQCKSQVRLVFSLARKSKIVPEPAPNKPLDGRLCHHCRHFRFSYVSWATPG